ncbi:MULTISPECIES: hypothetical protein [Pseudomonas]|uniref:hypothetical protein n=1 Tax=Pseudomonas TaxID=286 RepID=UPI000B27EDB3|nr:MULTISPECIES: hypothetical protein [Pseudomonas]ULT68204.1 hypothetical protein L1O02_17460 [Pseudomonas sp. BC42]
MTKRIEDLDSTRDCMQVHRARCPFVQAPSADAQQPRHGKPMQACLGIPGV